MPNSLMRKHVPVVGGKVLPHTCVHVKKKSEKKKPQRNHLIFIEIISLVQAVNVTECQRDLLVDLSSSGLHTKLPLYLATSYIYIILSYLFSLLRARVCVCVYVFTCQRLLNLTRSSEKKWRKVARSEKSILDSFLELSSRVKVS